MWPGTVEAFLARLEHEDDVAGQLLAAVGQETGGAGEHGGVQVVAAGVHGAVNPGGEPDAGAFLDGRPSMSARSRTAGLVAVACGAPPRRTAVTDVVLSPR